MMNWIYYLLEANLYLSIFYIFYRLVLHKETFYAANRFYLLSTAILAFVLPFLQIGFLLKPLIQYQQVAYSQTEAPKMLFTLENVLLMVYSIIALFLFVRLLFGFKHLIAILIKQDVKFQNGIKVIELSNTRTAYSFFGLLFIDPALPNKNIVIKHELVHINQKHSIDVLFFEALQIVSWFNPLIYFLKKDVKLLHEFLADEATTNADIERYEYAMFLIQNTYDSQHLSLTNQIFNSSILKQRITMLNQKKSTKWARLRLLITLPLAGAMVCASTMAFTKDYGVDLYPKAISSKFIPKQTTPKKAKAKEIVIEEPARPVPPRPPVGPPIVKPDAPKKGKVPGPPAPPKTPKKGIAPPPPPVEPKPIKGEVLEIKLAPPPPIEPAPAKKKYDKDDVIYGDPIPGTK